MEETGVVLSVTGDSALLRFERTEACKKCGACHLGSDGEMLLTVDNSLGAEPGDQISVSLQEGQLLSASLLAYGLPLAGLLIGVWLATLLSPLFPHFNSDALTVLCAAILVLCAFFINRLLEPGRRRKRKYRPTPIRIQKPQQEED